MGRGPRLPWGANPGPSACQADVLTAALWNRVLRSYVRRISEERRTVGSYSSPAACFLQHVWCHRESVGMLGRVCGGVRREGREKRVRQGLWGLGCVPGSQRQSCGWDQSSPHSRQLLLLLDFVILKRERKKRPPPWSPIKAEPRPLSLSLPLSRALLSAATRRAGAARAGGGSEARGV